MSSKAVNHLGWFPRKLSYTVVSSGTHNSALFTNRWNDSKVRKNRKNKTNSIKSKRQQNSFLLTIQSAGPQKTCEKNRCLLASPGIVIQAGGNDDNSYRSTPWLADIWPWRKWIDPWSSTAQTPALLHTIWTNLRLHSKENFFLHLQNFIFSPNWLWSNCSHCVEISTFART
jgi:hypothetical protein